MLKYIGDFEKLEKFGFYKSNEFTYSYEIEPIDERVEEEGEFKSNFSSEGFAMIEISVLTREVEFFTTTDDECWWNINIFYDLIKAGLVEKGVEE